MCAAMSMQAQLLKEALSKNNSDIHCAEGKCMYLIVGQRREMAANFVAQRGVGIALACQTFGLSESCYRYSPKLGGENKEIADLLIGLTNARKTWGFLCFLYLRNVQGRRWNHKRVYRIYRELELNLRIKPRKRLKRDKPDALTVPDAPNAVWSMDFMADRLGPSRRMKPFACHATDGRAFRLLNVLDRCRQAFAKQTPRGTSTARGWASRSTFRCQPSGSSAA
jgi:putative transposase